MGIYLHKPSMLHFWDFHVIVEEVPSDHLFFILHAVPLTSVTETEPDFHRRRSAALEWTGIISLYE